MTRTAISPRFATRTDRSGGVSVSEIAAAALRTVLARVGGRDDAGIERQRQRASRERWTASMRLAASVTVIIVALHQVSAHLGGRAS